MKAPKLERVGPRLRLIANKFKLQLAFVPNCTACCQFVPYTHSYAPAIRSSSYDQSCGLKLNRTRMGDDRRI